MLELKECSKEYKNKKVFENINYKFEDEIYWLNAPNGMGKSVLCRCIVGLENFTTGNVEGERRKVLYLPDVSVADMWLTIAENIELMKYYFKLKIDEKTQNRIINKLGIDDENDLLSNVSVGTSMKVGLFLVFIEKHWSTIVLDETLSHIDNTVKAVVLEELEKRKKEGTTIFVIHHGDLENENENRKTKKIYLHIDRIDGEE